MNRSVDEYERVLEKRRFNPPNPLKKGAKIRILVPLFKGDLGGFTPTTGIKNNFSNYPTDRITIDTMQRWALPTIIVQQHPYYPLTSY
jgi:hypothetical protein